MAYYDVGQLQSLLRQVGFPEDKIVLMAAIGMSESSGRSDAINDGSGTHSIEYSVGLWQINTRVHKVYSVQQLTDPLINAKEALRIFNLQGLRAWGSYTDGRYKKYLAASQAAYGNNNTIFNVNDSSINPATILIGAILFYLIID